MKKITKKKKSEINNILKNKNGSFKSKFNIENDYDLLNFFLKNAFMSDIEIDINFYDKYGAYFSARDKSIVQIYEILGFEIYRALHENTCIVKKKKGFTYKDYLDFLKQMEYIDDKIINENIDVINEFI